MMTDDELLKLSAYADGETTEPERRTIEAELQRVPAYASALAAFKKLDSAAQNEAVPQPSLDIWECIVERQTSMSLETVSRLNQFAATEHIPSPSNDQFLSAWNEINLVTNARKEVAPTVHDQRWQNVWKGISTRTVAPAIQTTHAAPVLKPKWDTNQKTKPNVVTAPFSSAWMWAVGAGLAASILLALWLPHDTSHVQPAVTTAPESPVATSASMSIPESQDDHYGVRVRFVPGSSDPVVSLYYKPEQQRVNSLLGNDLDDDR